MDTKTRFFQDPKQSFFLFGPRGTGKSTWVKRHLGNALIIGLLAPEVYRFKEDYLEAKTCLLYRGQERIKIKNILCLPCEEFLMNLVPQNPIRLSCNTNMIMPYFANLEMS